MITTHDPIRDAKGKVTTFGYRVSFDNHKPDAPRPGFGAALYEMALAERARRESVAK